jgi:uncharacterized protein YyaL (SSP411 family)
VPQYSGQRRSAALHAATARDILDYVLRDMTHPDGGFYSAEDADSEGYEGKFYCWTHDELSKLLSLEEFNVAARHFGITKEGNFVDHSHPSPLPGQNVLSVAHPMGAPASGPARFGDINAPDRRPTLQDESLLASAKRKMLTARSKRIRPHLDDKILASWNGLMLGALARAYAVLGDAQYLAAAEKNLAFIQDKLWEAPQSGTGVLPVSNSLESKSETGATPVLHHRWRDGERDNVQLLESCAFLLSGVIELYEATLEPKRLDFAIALAEAMIAKFHDPENGGFWQSAADAKDLILRVKDDHDGAEPSGNSVATLALLKLAAITGREDFRKPAEATLRLFAHHLQNFPQAMPFMLHAFDFSLEEPRRVVITGNSASKQFRDMLRAVHSVYQPNKVVLGNAGAIELFARTLPAKNGPVVYLCTGNACQAPTNDLEKIRQMMC